MSELTGDRLAGKPNLESMPMEIQVEIMGHFLKHHGPLILFPQDTYTNQSWAFGSLGILSVSKHLSAIGLSVLYGENSFLIPTSDHRLEEFDDSKKYDVEEGPVSCAVLHFGHILNC